LVKQGEVERQRSPRVGSVATTIAILRLLASARQPLGVNAIARKLGLRPSTCFNILKTLVSEDFVDFNVDTKAYSLGSGMISIARRALDPEAAFELIRSRAEEFSDELSLTVGLWRVVKRSRIVLVGYEAGAPNMRIHLTIGQRLPLLMGATGRCIAAISRLGEAEIEQEFSKLRWQEPPSLDEYRQQVEHARQHGWGHDEGQFVRGVTTIATPIFDVSGAISYCLTATMFNGQYPPERYDAIARKMLAISGWAAQRFGTAG
jgi:DNA-binding IclR family transcriptional regulator